MKSLVLTCLSLLVLGTLLVFNSCKEYWPWPGGDGPGHEDEIRSYTGTQSPGDVWTFDLNYSTMMWLGTWDHGTELDVSDDITFDGSFTQLPSGFLKLVITNTSPPDPLYPSDGTAFFYALEIPGMSFFANPKGSLTGNIINSVDRSSCPAVADFEGNYNYIRIAPGTTSYSPLTESAYGDFWVDGSTVPGKIRIPLGVTSSLDCIYAPWTSTVDVVPYDIPGWGECLDGMVDFYDAGTLIARSQFTSSGIFMIDFGAGAGGIYGSKFGTGITVDDITGKKYIGFVSDPISGKHREVTMEFDPITHVGYGSLYSDVESDILDTETVNPISITFVYTSGLFYAQMQHHSGLLGAIAGIVSIDGPDIVMTALTHHDLAPYGAMTIVMAYTP